MSDPVTGLMRLPKSANSLRGYHQANLILPKVMRAIAKLEGVNGQFAVAPKSPDREDRHAAKLSELVFQHLRQVTRFQSKRRRALLWAAICGSGFHKITWDPDAGTPNRIYLKDDSDFPDITALEDGEVRQQKERKGRFKDAWPGEIDCEVVETPLVWWDPNARGGGIDKSCTWIAQVTSVPVDQIKERYGVEVVPDQSELRGAEMFREAFAFMADGIFGTTSAKRASTSAGARVIEYFEVPLRSNGMKGRHLIISGGKVLKGSGKDGENKYAASGSPLPFVKYDWFPCEGRFIGLSLVEQLRPSQRARNESRTHEMAHARTNGYSPTYLPRGGGVKAVQLVGMHGAIYEYNSSIGQPIFGQAPNLPPYIGELPNKAEAEMDKIAGQLDPSNNRMPGQLRSGAAIQAMQADNNAILTPTSESMLESIADCGTQMLQLAGLYYTSARVMQVVGKGGDYDVRSFVGADLRGHYDLVVLSQPGALDSIEARQAKLMDALQLQALDLRNPEEKVLFFKGMGFHTSDEFINALVQQDAAEEREIERMIETPEYLPQVMPWQDANVRVKTLERYMNSLAFEGLDELAKKKLVMRWQGFTQVIAQRMQEQMALAQAMSGGAAPKGEPSPPKATR